MILKSNIPIHKFGGIIILLVISYVDTFSQKDSTQKMKFDFGITRDQNINLWPVYKRTTTKFEIDRQVIFPIYRNYQNLRLGEKRSHLFPLYWSDSSKYGKNLRVLSTYYPSILHINELQKERTKTYTFLELAPRINLLEFKKSEDGLVMQNNLLFFLWFKNNQITKKSYLIVFPAYWQFKSPMKSTSLLLPLYFKGSYFNNKYKYLTVTPLYWRYESPRSKSNLLLPIWWNKQVITSKDTAKSNLLFPLYYSFKNHKTNSKVLFPLVWQFNNDRYKSLTIPPLLSFGRNEDLSRRHLVITPLFWDIKYEEKHSRVLFPLVWSNKWEFKNDNYSSFIIFPFYWSQVDNKNKQQILIPFIWSKSTPDFHSFTFLPLFSFGQSTDKYSNYFAITPLFWHTKSPASTSNKLIPVWWYKKTNDGTNYHIRNILFPVYYGWRKNSSEGDIYFPLVWKLKTSNYSSFTFLPFVTTGKSTDGKKAFKAITPLFWQIKVNETNTKLLFPVWWQRDKNLDGKFKSSSLVLLAYWKYTTTDTHNQGLFPLYWELQNKYSRSNTLLPFFSKGETTDSSRKYLAITPLFWHLKNEYRSINTLIPIWWNKNSYDKNKHLNIILPIFYSSKDSINCNRVVFPILWSLRSQEYQSFTLIPILSTGRDAGNDYSHLAITPLFWLFQKPGGYTTSLLPIFFRSVNNEGAVQSNKTVIFPIYWSLNYGQVRNTILFPAIWSLDNSNYKSFTLFPLLSIGRSYNNLERHLVITPFYWNIHNQNRKSQVLFPVLFNIQKFSDKNPEKYNVLFPVYWSIKKSSVEFKTLFPLYWKFSNNKKSITTVIPFYCNGSKSNGTKFKCITPLYWQFEDKFKIRKILFPIYTSYRDTLGSSKLNLFGFLFRYSGSGDSSSSSFLWPIIERSKGENYRYFRFAPIVWSKKSPSFSYFTIQPFYYYSRGQEGETYRFLWEFYVHRNQLNIKKSNSILWKVVTWEKYSNNDREFRVLHLLYANSSVNGKIEKSIFPFYYLTKDEIGNKSLSVMLYFYNSIKKLIPNTNEFYREDRIFWIIRFRSNYWQLKQKGIDVK